jgi:hypothetical protein
MEKRYLTDLSERAQVVHSGTAWLSEAGLATNRVEPVVEG